MTDRAASSEAKTAAGILNRRRAIRNTSNTVNVSKTALARLPLRWRSKMFQSGSTNGDVSVSKPATT